MKTLAEWRRELQGGLKLKPTTLFNCFVELPYESERLLARAIADRLYELFVDQNVDGEAFLEVGYLDDTLETTIDIEFAKRFVDDNLHFRDMRILEEVHRALLGFDVKMNLSVRDRFHGFTLRGAQR